MNASYIFVDLQGFKDMNNDFIVKEMSLALSNHTQTFLVKPPYAYSTLSNNEKKHVSWIEKNRGIYWKQGYIDYREFKRIAYKLLKNKNIFVKGLEKVKWIKELCSECNVENIEDKGCNNFFTLYSKYCKGVSFNCNFHVKECALKNVICIKKWYLENN